MSESTDVTQQLSYKSTYKSPSFILKIKSFFSINNHLNNFLKGKKEKDLLRYDDVNSGGDFERWVRKKQCEDVPSALESCAGHLL